MTERNREFARQLERAAAADAELQTAAIAAEMGVLAFKRGFAAWSEGASPPRSPRP